EMVTDTLSPTWGTLTPRPSDTLPPGLTDSEWSATVRVGATGWVLPVPVVVPVPVPVVVLLPVVVPVLLPVVVAVLLPVVVPVLLPVVVPVLLPVVVPVLLPVVVPVLLPVVVPVLQLGEVPVPLLEVVDDGVPPETSASNGVIDPMSCHSAFIVVEL